MLGKLRVALKDYENKELWQQQVKTVMLCDFGWTQSARKYVELYNEFLK